MRLGGSKLADRERVWYLDIGPVFVEPDGTITREKLRDLGAVVPDLGHTGLNPARSRHINKSYLDEALGLLV